MNKLIAIAVTILFAYAIIKGAQAGVRTLREHAPEHEISTVAPREITPVIPEVAREDVQTTKEVTIVAQAPRARKAHRGHKVWTCGNWHGLASSTGMVKDCEWR